MKWYQGKVVLTFDEFTKSTVGFFPEFKKHEERVISLHLCKTKCVHYQDYFATADYTIKKKKKGAYTLSELSWPHTGPIGDGKYNILWIKR